ncbi:MAG: nucleotidyltransferase domain-containing protein [Vulcanimicrobiota bacterium]
MKYSTVVPYAMDFVSFVLEHISQKCAECIRNILLFGSGARSEYTKESDIDIFFEVSENIESVEKEVIRASEEFYSSVKNKGYWKLKGFRQIFSCKVGTQEIWENIYPALLSDGIVLYGKYFSSEIKGRNQVLLSWENINSSTTRINLYRTLYGYAARGKRYPGMLERYESAKLSKGSILVPLEYREHFRDLFKKLKVPVKELLVNIL